ncbi:hypothetical protein BOTBODRAFT_60691 [Botryobasidium botryosum FD-172 SS1]|uniref:PCI domain-containing protein n=1 Tax=Botryobasidium botryosum (strain FD-172 SS1) TaxID=930990 RepID=A0A067LSR1_BOTB1|nr:hypothetical protein BOTBODRAFT_60691 [Botryobasidium botryosum FD-172 SS1]
MASPPEYDLQLTSVDDVIADSKASTSNQQTRKRPVVVVDDQHPFDLDAYMGAYTGRTAISRLLYISEASRMLAPQALLQAIKLLKSTQDTTTYLSAVQTYNSLPSVSKPISVDTRWVDQTQANVANESERLEVELKSYLSNMIKESTRMGHRDLANHFAALGDYQSAILHYNKSREYSTTSRHILEQCLSVLELVIEHQNYAHIATYVFKAEGALDIPSPTAKKASLTQTLPPQTAAQAAQASSDHAKVQAKLDFASALAHMTAGRYDKAAYQFSKLGKGLSDWFGTVISPADVAIYATMCALAGLSRSAIKASLLENDTFGFYLQQESYVRELLDAYMASKFKLVLELLEKHSTRHLLDIHLGALWPDMQKRITNRSLVMYFQPFSSVRLDKMATAFGFELVELERLVVALIQDGSIKARVDSHNKILKARDLDQRALTYNQAFKAGAEMEASTRKLLLRMKLMQADLIVKGKKGANKGQGQEEISHEHMQMSMMRDEGFVMMD